MSNAFFWCFVVQKMRWMEEGGRWRSRKGPQFAPKRASGKPSKKRDGLMEILTVISAFNVEVNATCLWEIQEAPPTDNKRKRKHLTCEHRVQSSIIQVSPFYLTETKLINSSTELPYHLTIIYNVCRRRWSRWPNRLLLLHVHRAPHHGLDPSPW